MYAQTAGDLGEPRPAPDQLCALGDRRAALGRIHRRPLGQGHLQLMDPPGGVVRRRHQHLTAGTVTQRQHHATPARGERHLAHQHRPQPGGRILARGPPLQTAGEVRQQPLRGALAGLAAPVHRQSTRTQLLHSLGRVGKQLLPHLRCLRRPRGRPVGLLSRAAGRLNGSQSLLNRAWIDPAHAVSLTPLDALETATDEPETPSGPAGHPSGGGPGMGGREASAVAEFTRGVRTDSRHGDWPSHDA